MIKGQEYTVKKKRSFQHVVLGKLENYMRRKLEQYLTSHTKLNPKSIKDLNVELDAIKLLEENIDITPLYINHDRIFLDSLPSEYNDENKNKNKQMGLN